MEDYNFKFTFNPLKGMIEEQIRTTDAPNFEACVQVDGTISASILQGTLEGGSTTDSSAYTYIVGNAIQGDTTANCDFLDPGDGTGIALAISSSQSRLGFSVFVKGGTYTLDATEIATILPLPWTLGNTKNTKISGDFAQRANPSGGGGGATILIVPSGSRKLIDTSQYLTLENLYFRLTSAVSGATGTEVIDAKGLTLKGVRFGDTETLSPTFESLTAIARVGSGEFEAQDITFYSVGVLNAGFEFDNTRHFKVDNVKFMSNCSFNNAFWVTGFSVIEQFNFSNIFMDGPITGIRIDGGFATDGCATFDNMYFDMGSGDTAILMDADGGYYNVNISNCSFFGGTGRNGFILTGSTDSRLAMSNCYFDIDNAVNLVGTKAAVNGCHFVDGGTSIDAVDSTTVLMNGCFYLGALTSDGGSTIAVGNSVNV